MASCRREVWHPIDQRVVALDEPIEVGLVVCSHMPQTPCQATFTNVSLRRLSVD